MNPVPGRLSILGFSVDSVDMDGALAACRRLIAGTRPHQIITANPLMLLAAAEDAALAAAFRDADLVVPDGVGLAAAARLQGRHLPRLAGIDLMDALCALAASEGKSVFLLGAAPGVAEAATAELRRRHPRLRVAGTLNGHFQGDAETPVHAVSAARPDILFVALSTPFQDAWIHRNLPRLGVRLAMGVGGSFDVLSGRLRRAPLWMRRAGLEWLFRLVQEPARVGRMARLPLFLAKALLSR